MPSRDNGAVLKGVRTLFDSGTTLAQGDSQLASQIDVREATADLKVAMADLAKTKVFVDYTRIVSPWDGVVTKRSCNEGDFVRSGELGGSDPILTIVKIGKVRVITCRCRTPTCRISTRETRPGSASMR